jgi:DNA-binding MarR family transcriptional regulator
VSERARAAAGRGAVAVGSRFAGPAESAGFLLWQVASAWQRAIRAALDDLDLTHAQFVLLATVVWLAAESPEVPVTQTVVAVHTATDAVMTSEVMRTLERKGYVERKAHPDDARAKRIVSTAAGRRLVRRALPLVEAVDAQFFGTPNPVLQSLVQRLTA